MIKDEHFGKIPEHEPTFVIHPSTQPAERESAVCGCLQGGRKHLAESGAIRRGVNGPAMHSLRTGGNHRDRPPGRGRHISRRIEKDQPRQMPQRPRHLDRLHPHESNCPPWRAGCPDASLHRTAKQGAPAGRGKPETPLQPRRTASIPGWPGNGLGLRPGNHPDAPDFPPDPQVSRKIPDSRIAKVESPTRHAPPARIPRHQLRSTSQA